MQIDLNNMPIEVMDTPNKRTMGMMRRDHLNGAMTFPFDEVSERSFWMKNCKIPLDIVFLVDNKIKSLSKNAQPCIEDEECVSHHGIADTVIEFNGGFCNDNNLEVGDKLDFYV